MSVTDLSQFRQRKAEAEAEPERTITGKCRCLHCKHTWEGTYPVGSMSLECPACGVEKGIPAYLVTVAGYSWHCNCGNDLYQLTPNGAMCVLCGGQHFYDDLQEPTTWQT